MAVVALSSSDHPVLQCLIGHESYVELGQSATVNIIVETRKDAVILLLSIAVGGVKSRVVKRL